MGLHDTASLAHSARSFLREFLAFAQARAVLAGFLVGAAAILDGAGLLLIIPLVGLVTGAGRGGGRIGDLAAGIFQQLGLVTMPARLALTLALFALLMILRGFFITGRDVVLAQLQIGFIEHLRGTLMAQMAQARWEQVARQSHGRITHLLSTDIQRLTQACNIFVQCIVALALLLIHGALALALSPALALLAFALQGIGFAAILPVLARTRNLGTYLVNANQALHASTVQFLGGLKQAMSQNQQERFITRFRQTLTDIRSRQVAHIRHFSTTRVAAQTLTAVAGAGLILAGAGYMHIPAPVLITLLFIIARMSGPAQQLQQGALVLASTLPSYDAIAALRREFAPAPQPPATAPGHPPLDGPIVFEQVRFFHPGSERGVEALSLTIQPGECIGVAGPSGAGKTTFVDLLAGLIEPQQGSIRIGAYSLTAEIARVWRDRLAYIAQDPFLFHETVRWNLSWANPSASEPEMWEALTATGADSLVQHMPNSLDTTVGERGTLVSGGERQRLALAGALLRAPKLLILDEATSAIDIASEKVILAHLQQRIPTIIMVAHRPESLTLCSRIITISRTRQVNLP
jgi:ABC-type multidrug transport system, ATPase and permease components